MWPSTPRSGNLANIPCPKGPPCTLPNCLFNHQVSDRPPPQPPATTVSRAAPAPDLPGLDDSNMSNGEKLPTTTKAPESAPTSQSKLPAAPSASTASSASIAPKASTTLKASAASSASTVLPSSSSKAAAAKPTVDPDKPVPLRPRQLPKDPAVYTRRLALLQALHAAMVIHNDRLIRAKNPEIKALHLNANQLNQLAIDEEAQIAISNPSVYENILKQRLVKLKGMPPELWAKERRAAITAGMPKKARLSRVNTGLSPEDEVAFVRTLKCHQNELEDCEFVTSVPTDTEVDETRLALLTAAGWEVCDRCNTRFQVFPERNEQGQLTTGGECSFHYGKIDRRKNKHLCCDREVGSPGCATHDTHVFKFKDPKRMSLIMPFIHTPENDKVPKSAAVSCDCEMGYTTKGLELLRLTVLSWPQHQPLVDVLVRPFGQILDFNTRFSGVTKDQFVNAKAYDPENPRPVRKDLRFVESPYVARELFLSHVSPETPIIGHALENDLNIIRLIHPVIVDTSVLYPTNRGPPYRFGLRQLAKDHLNEDIQQGGEAGHDSFEDSRTAGELVRLKIKKKWARKEADGFWIKDGVVHPPLPPSPVADKCSMAPTANMTGSMETRPAIKRKLEEKEEDDDSTEPPPKKLEA